MIVLWFRLKVFPVGQVTVPGPLMTVELDKSSAVCALLKSGVKFAVAPLKLRVPAPLMVPLL